MARIFRQSEVDATALQGLTVAVIGYGSQGSAHALNLKDSGAMVVVGLHANSASIQRAQAEGLDVRVTEAAAAVADVVMLALADIQMAEIVRDQVLPQLKADATILVAHGLNVRYGLMRLPDSVDIAMVSPLGPGNRVREDYLAGRGVPALVAVERDVSGSAWKRTLAYGAMIGAARAGLIETTFREETEADLFGEQTVLCGGLAWLVKAGFETLVEAGFQPEAAYAECVHQIGLLADLISRFGVEGMLREISDTAEFGALRVGREVVGDSSRQAMKEALKRVQDGSFVREMLDDANSGSPKMRRWRQEIEESQLAKTGQVLRGLLQADDAGPDS